MADADESKPLGMKQKGPRLRKVRRLLLWAFLLSVILAVAGVTTAVLLFKNLTGVVNYALSDLAHPYSLEIGSLKLPEAGVLSLKDITVTDRDGEAEILHVPEARVEFDWEELRERRVRSVEVRRPRVRIGAGAGNAGNLKADAGAPSESGDKPSAVFIEKLRVVEADVSFSVGPGAEFSGNFDLEGEEVSLGGSGNLSPRPLRVQGRGLQVAGAGEIEKGIVFVGVPRVEGRVEARGDFRGGQVSLDAIQDPVIRVTPSFLQALKSGTSPQGSEGAGDPSAESVGGVAAKDEEMEGWVLRMARVNSGELVINGFDAPDAGMLLPDLVAGFGFTLENLELGAGGLRSSALQTAQLRKVSIRGGAQGARNVTGTIDSVDLEIIPDRFAESGMIEKLHFFKPRAEITSTTIARFLPSEYAKEIGLKEAPAVASAREAERSAPKTDPAGRKVYLVRDLAVHEGELSFDPEGIRGGLPIASGTLRIETGKAGEDDVSYRAVLADLKFKDPKKVVGEDIAKGQRIEIDFTARRVQRDQRIDRLELIGFHLRVGESLQKLAGEGGTPSAAGAPGKGGAQEKKKGWQIGEVGIRESTVHIQDLVPGLPSVRFGVQTPAALTDVTVTGSGEKSVEDLVQRVELVNLEIMSPYDPLATVADLRTIFVEFTWKELLDRLIRKVEVVNPELHVGEHLFWYIDNYRRIEKERQETAEKLLEGDQLAAGASKPVETGPKTWRVGRVDAFNGKIILAPKGYPIGFTPFPFSGSTDLEGGVVDLRLEIPKETYEYDELKLTLEGLTGAVEFNLPLRERDNNLVETFEVDKLRFRNFEMDNAYLSVTYDRQGIYGKYGGEAYEGYLNGEFNIYIGEKYAWDAWVAGTDMELEPFTAVVAPDVVAMEGTVSATLVAEGLGMELNQADGSMEMVSPGRMEIPRLEHLIEEFPRTWSVLQSSFAEAGVEALQNYEFEEGEGKLDFLQRDGTLTLSLRGAEGTRSLDMRFHDIDLAGLNISPVTTSN